MGRQALITLEVGLRGGRTLQATCYQMDDFASFREGTRVRLQEIRHQVVIWEEPATVNGVPFDFAGKFTQVSSLDFGTRHFAAVHFQGRVMSAPKDQRGARLQEGRRKLIPPDGAVVARFEDIGRVEPSLIIGAVLADAETLVLPAGAVQLNRRRRSQTARPA